MGSPNNGRAGSQANFDPKEETPEGMSLERNKTDFMTSLTWWKVGLKGTDDRAIGECGKTFQ